MKKLLLSVKCVSGVSERPESFYIELSEQLVKRIKELGRLVSNVDAYAIEEFEHSGEWSDMYIDPSELDEARSNLDEIVALLQEEESRVEVPMLRVTKDEFRFTATPKHRGDDMALATVMVKISELENDTTYINLD